MPTNEGPLSVTTGEAISAHRRVISNGSTVSMASASQQHDGVCNTAAASGAVTAMDPSNRSGTFWIEASTSITAGNVVYAAASGMIASSGTLILGRALNSASANEIVEVLPVAQWGNGSVLLYSAVAASTAVTAASATSFGNTVTIPANSLKAGDVIEYTVAGIAPTTDSTDTLTLTVLFGSVTVATSDAVNSTNDDIMYMAGQIVLRTIGATGTLVAAGLNANGVASTVTSEPFLKGSTTIDTTAAIVFDVKGVWSDATGNSCRLDITNVGLHRTAA